MRVREAGSILDHGICGKRRVGCFKRATTLEVGVELLGAVVDRSLAVITPQSGLLKAASIDGVKMKPHAFVLEAPHSAVRGVAACIVVTVMPENNNVCVALALRNG